MPAQRSNRPPRFFIIDLPSLPEDCRGRALPLPESEARHAMRVLRLPTGAPIEAVHRATGFRFLGTLRAEGDLGFIDCDSVAPPQSQLQSISVGVPLLKAGNTELACEKATELGVSSIVVWQSERSVSRFHDEADVEKKLRRCVSAVEAAVKQCRRTSVPAVSAVSSLELLLKTPEFGSEHSRFFCSLSPEARPLQLVDFGVSPVAILIGPEGDFSPTETEALLAGGVVPISLGNDVLRAETAVIAAVAMVKALWKD